MSVHMVNARNLKHCCGMCSLVTLDFQQPDDIFMLHYFQALRLVTFIVQHVQAQTGG